MDHFFEKMSKKDKSVVFLKIDISTVEWGGRLTSFEFNHTHTFIFYKHDKVIAKVPNTSQPQACQEVRNRIMDPLLPYVFWFFTLHKVKEWGPQPG